MTAVHTDHLLAGIRREIDEIDDELIGLLLRRWAMPARVRDLKGGMAGMAATPYRPAREAEILRRLLDKAGGAMPAADLVRLWRVILSASITAQAAVTIHVDASVGSCVDLRLLIAGHFCGMAVEVHGDIGSALAAAGTNPVDLAIFAAAGPWADHFALVAANGSGVVAALPLLQPAAMQHGLLVAARGETGAGGGDRTILLSRAALPANSSLRPLQHWPSGGWIVSAIAGPPGGVQDSVTALAAQHPELQLRLAGAVPAPIEVQP